MPTTLTKNSLTLLFILFLGCIHSAYATELKYLFPDGIQIDILSPKEDPSNSQTQESKIRVTQTDESLRKQLALADEAFVLSKETFSINGSIYFSAIVRLGRR